MKGSSLALYYVLLLFLPSYHGGISSRITIHTVTRPTDPPTQLPEDVSFERVRPRVRLVAQVALILPGARVELGVRLEVPGGSEAQRALRASVRLIARVRSTVDHELAAAGEALAAVLAGVPVNVNAQVQVINRARSRLSKRCRNSSPLTVSLRCEFARGASVSPSRQSPCRKCCTCTASLRCGLACGRQG